METITNNTHAAIGVVCLDCVDQVDSKSIHYGQLVLLSGVDSDYSRFECWNCGSTVAGYRYGVNVYSRGN